MEHQSKSTKHKECFINNESCKGKIKEAHILSRAATMSLICGEAKGGLKVVQVAGKNKQTGKLEPTEIGWTKASAYYCFCDIHDSKIFEPIENDNSFDIESNNQLFLHTFRSFAYVYHKQRERIDENYEIAKSLTDTINSLSNIFGGDSQPNYDEIQESYDAQMYSFNIIRDRLIDAWTSNNYKGLTGFSVQIDVSFPFASAGTLMAEIVDTNRTSRVFYNPEEGHLVLPHPGIILTVFPVKGNKTIIIFTALSDDKNARFTLEKFERLSEQDPQGAFAKAVSGLMLSVNKENTFLHPKMWEAMKANGDAIKLQQDIQTNRGADLLHSTLWVSQVNLFSNQYTCKSLGITI